MNIHVILIVQLLQTSLFHSIRIPKERSDIRIHYQLQHDYSNTAITNLYRLSSSHQSAFAKA